MQRSRTVTTALGVEVLLRIASLPRVCRLLGLRLPSYSPTTDSSNLNGSNAAVVERITRSVESDVDWAYAHLPLPDTCLRRSLTAGSRLRAFQPHLVIGVRRTPALDAHAWLLVGHIVLDWSGRHHEFTPIG